MKRSFWIVAIVPMLVAVLAMPTVAEASSIKNKDGIKTIPTYTPLNLNVPKAVQAERLAAGSWQRCRIRPFDRN
jgi:hypothetical protein